MEEFVKELEENEELRMAMQGLMKTIGDEVDENIVNNLDETSVGSNNNNFDNHEKSKGTSFQDKINQTMNKLQNSSEQLDVCINIVNEI